MRRNRAAVVLTFNPSSREANKMDLWAEARLAGLHSEFQNSQCYAEQPYIEKQASKQTKNKNLPSKYEKLWEFVKYSRSINKLFTTRTDKIDHTLKFLPPDFEKLSWYFLSVSTCSLYHQDWGAETEGSCCERIVKFIGLKQFLFYRIWKKMT